MRCALVEFTLSHGHTLATFVDLAGIYAGETKTVDLYAWNGLAESCAPGAPITDQINAAGIQGGWVEVVGADPAVTGPFDYRAGNGIPKSTG